MWEVSQYWEHCAQHFFPLSLFPFFFHIFFGYLTFFNFLQFPALLKCQNILQQSLPTMNSINNLHLFCTNYFCDRNPWRRRSVPSDMIWEGATCSFRSTMLPNATNSQFICSWSTSGIDVV
jgi:hypothetical protein